MLIVVLISLGDPLSLRVTHPAFAAAGGELVAGTELVTVEIDTGGVARIRLLPSSKANHLSRGVMGTRGSGEILGQVVKRRRWSL